MESPTPCAPARNGRTAHTAIPRFWTQTFPATTDQAPGARRYLASILNGSSLTDDALACLGELVNNSLIHSASRLPGGTFTVHVRVRPRRLRVEVCDDGGAWAPHLAGDDPNVGNDGAWPALSGRGLLIVAALADAWDINPKTTATSRTAWFELASPAGSNTQQGGTTP